MDRRNQATAEAIGEHNRGAESIRDRPDDREPEPSAWGTLPSNPVEAIEHASELTRGNPRTIVRDGDRRPLAIPDTHGDGPAGPVIADSFVEEIADHLCDHERRPMNPDRAIVSWRLKA